MTKARTLADITIPSGTPVGTTDTQTLTNKTLTAPTIASANLTTALTVAGASGTSGQVLTSAGSGAAPTWATVSAGPIGTDLSYVDYLLTTSSELSTAVGSAVLMQSVSLDGTSELMLIHGTASAHAVVFNTSTNTFGTPALVRTGAFSSMQNITLTAISSTSVLVCSLPGSVTNLETVVLTVSGNTITVNTPVATTLSAASRLVVANTRLVAVGSSYVLNYYNSTGTTPKFRAITVSGSTPSIGSELAYAGGTSFSMHHSYAHSSSILLHFSMTDATTVFVYPISVSGTTLTGGTAATVATTGTSFCTGALSNSRYALAYINTTGRGAVVSVAGTTASISTAATTLTVGSWLPQLQVFSNQAFILTGSTGSDRIGVITDTSGTATVGTPFQPNAGSFIGFLDTGKVFNGSTTAGISQYYQFGISAGDAVVEKTFQTVTNQTVVTATNFTGCFYSQPLSGPPQSKSGQAIVLRTSTGKVAPAFTSTNPFTISVDGAYPAKLQQGANPFQLTYNDAISDASAWAIPSTNAASATTIQLRKVTLV